MTYIPRSPLNATSAPSAIPLQVRKRRTIHVFSILATTILILSCVGAVGSYFYKDFVVVKRLEAAKNSLRSVTNADDAQKIEEIRMYDEKLIATNELLERHIAPSQIFKVLEDVTKQTVQFNSLEFSYDPGYEANVTLKGNTNEFTSVALQKMQFLKDTVFSSFVTKDITSSQNEVVQNALASSQGDVDFTVVGVFKNGLLEYTGTEPEKPTGTNLVGTLSETINLATTSNQITPAI